MDKRREAISKAVADFLEIPRDLVLDLPKITITGRNELYIQNHHGIIEYNPGLLRINISRGFLEIEGKNLEIKALMPEEMNICGEIFSLKYLD